MSAEWEAGAKALLAGHLWEMIYHLPSCFSFTPVLAAIILNHSSGQLAEEYEVCGRHLRKVLEIW